MDPDTVDLQFQCKDILGRDVFIGHRDDDSSDGPPTSRDKLSNRRYQILLFGLTASGESVCLQVDNFCPFFYIRIPDVLRGDVKAVKHMTTWLLNGVPMCEHRNTKIEVETHKTLWDYNGAKNSTFLKVTVPSQALWRALKDKLLNKSSVPIEYKIRELFGDTTVEALASVRVGEEIESLSADGTCIALKVYESNIDPMLRFFHIQDVSPAGWVRVLAGNWTEMSSTDARASILAVADWADVVSGTGSVAPYLIGSWDIECYSSHGDFPQATKTWRKPVREILDTGVTVSNVKSLCVSLAKAIKGESKLLSPIYLKNKREDVTGEMLRVYLEQQGMEAAAEKALTGLRGAATREAKEEAITALDGILTDSFPSIAGDEIIQIGTVLYKLGVAVSKHIWVLGTTDEAAVKPPGADVPIEVYSFDDEACMIKAWIYWIGKKAPDVLIGYNIFGFDSKYIWDRLADLISSKEMKKAFGPLSCLHSRPPRLEEKFLSSSAMGDNTMWILSSPGRLQIDLLPYVRRNHNLDSYTLDNVSATFVSGAIQGGLKLVDMEGETYRFATKSTKGIVVGRFITLMDEENDRVVDRCRVVGVEAKALTVVIEGGDETLAEHGAAPVRWAQVKDDVSPKDIFRLHRGSATDRATIARYCLQDCDLVMELFTKLDIFNNSIAMANVCSVPVGFIFTRGQGIKIESLIFKECRKLDQLICVMPSAPRGEELIVDEDTEVEDSYEGAIVLEPHTGIYIDDPVTADDFASLYPSSIISENISHDTLISVKDYDNNGKFRCIREGSDMYDNLPGASYVNIEFDILRPDPGDMRKHPVKLRDGRRVARYIQDTKGTIPRILEMLLSSRKSCRKLAEKETDEFRKALLDAQQLAYKLTANSLYGQLGSGTFKIRRQVLAASTTAYGRKQLMFAKDVIEKAYGGGRDPRCDVECVYGDTDSIFLRFRPRDPVTGVALKGAEALRVAKDLTIESGKLVSSCLKPPHDFEFDKIFRSFCLLSKKRYVGDMSEDGLEDSDFHRKSMGIVMKRRDNAPIVKYVYGGVIERLLGTTDVATGVKSAFAFVQESAKDLLGGKFPLTKLTITKSLRSEYADPTRIAHKVLADRIGERDPGNKPSTSDRIPFVYIQHTGHGSAPKLQGERIELPSYIKEHGLVPDYAFYITNQIAKPLAQVFGLQVELIPGVTGAALATTRKARDVVAAREALAESLLFEKILLDAARRPEAMEARGQRSITSLFAKKSV